VNPGPYAPAAERFPTVRQSRLAAFDSCALSMKMDADYRSHWSGHPQVRGQIMHRVFAEALRFMELHEVQEIPVDQMIAILAEKLRQDDVDRECPDCMAPIVDVSSTGVITCENGHRFRGDFGNIPMRQIKDMRWVAVKWATDKRFEIQHLVDIEKRLHATITYPDGQGGHVDRVLTGQLDALFAPNQEEAIVLDWKDTWALPAPSDPGFEGFFQQRMYAWLVMKNYKTIQRVTLRQEYVRYSQYREATIWRHELDEVEQDLSALVERFDRSWTQQYFPPAPGKHCSVCARPGACPIFPGVRGDGQITDEHTARRLAGEAAVAEAALKQRKAALKAWSATNGPVVLNAETGHEKQLGYVERHRTARPSKEELEKAIMLGQGKVNLNSLYVKSTITKFEQHSPTPIEDTADDAMLMDVLAKSLEHQQ
jgi:hypothetical protein